MVQLGGEALTVVWSADGGTVVVGRKVGTVEFPYLLVVSVSLGGYWTNEGLVG